MSSVNKVILIGRVGKDPEVRNTQSGTSVANLTLATSEKYDGNEKTEWHDIVFWKGLAEVVEKYVKKGDQIYIEGKLTTRSWEHEGVKKYRTEIVASNMTMLGGKKESQTGYRKDEIQSGISKELDDDLPF